MKRVLIITYYWPPSGGAGVQRWVKFVKYLRDFGWEPVVYAPENPEYPSEDLSLASEIPSDIEVIKKTIWEPYDIYKTIVGKKGQKVNVTMSDNGKKNSFVRKIAWMIRGNLLIPDPRCFWIKPSYKFLINYIKDYPVDAIVSTGPPHSMHLIGLKLNQSTKIPWIADFRDPWTNIDFYKELKLTFLADKIHHYLEKKVLTNCSHVITVTPTCCRELGEIAGRSVDLIHNGYDEADVCAADRKKDDFFSITHVGSINKDRNSKVFWGVLSELIKKDGHFKEKLRIKLVGSIDPIVSEDIVQLGLSENVEIVGYLSHKEAVAFQQNSQVLLLLVNNTPNASGILTGKLYEYLASGRPILAIGPTDSDVAEILIETQTGRIADFQNSESMKNIILDYYERYKNDQLTVEAQSIEKFSRFELTRQLADLLNEAT